MRRDAASHAFVTRLGVAFFSKKPEHEKEKGRPPEEERAHKPMAELNDVINLITMLGCIRRHADHLVDQGETNHIYRGPRRSIVRAARAAHWRVARGGHRTRSRRRARTLPRRS